MARRTKDDPAAWDAFRTLCALLAPSRSGASVDLDAVDWDALVRQAQDHKVNPAVWRAIEGRAGIPNPIKAYFQLLHDMSARRNGALMEGLATAVAQLNARGMVPALLKGAACVASGLYRDPAERMMLDIDLLVAPDQALACADVLRAIGYEDMHDPHQRWVAQDTHHLPPLRAPSGDFSIEVHTWLLDKEYDPMLPREAVLGRSTEQEWRGGRVRQLDPADRVVHNIVHAQLHHQLSARGAVELRSLRELALLVLRHGEAIDWADVARRFAAQGRGRVLSEQATQCRDLMGVALPAAEREPERVMARLRAAVARPVEVKLSPLQVLREMLREYAFWFVRDPRLALNLLNPRWWPQRIRNIRDVFRRNAEHQG
ncbi:MAG: nucleotidyltransferase family protein [Xanthobacteraceae bacterium]|nr:nucleotidyltransferase family protein [Xanthobacteraceae bacterium]